MRKAEISPSLMCADICRLGETLRTFEEEGIEYLHIDVMDGHFVPNYALSADYCAGLHRHTDIPLDIHMMVTNPEESVAWLPIREGDLVSVHYEAATHLQRVLTLIRAKGGSPMVAINPGTSYELLREILPDVEGILVMTVNPGYAGQKMVPSAPDKIRRLRAWLDELGYEKIRIEVDGNVSYENAEKMRQAGADLFVAGTASIFKNGEVTKERIDGLRAALAKDTPV